MGCVPRVLYYGKIRQDSYVVWLAHNSGCHPLDSKHSTLSLSTRLQPLNLLELALGAIQAKLIIQSSWKSSAGTEGQSDTSCQLDNRDTVTV